MNTKKLIVSLCAIALGFSQTACQHVVYAADMANLNRRYERGEITKKEYDDRKAHFDFERSLAGPLITVGFTGPNQQERTSRDLQPATPPMTLLPGEYSYTPQPQYVYVQGPAHRPGGGYTPQPQQVYVQGPAHNPGGGYTPQPQQVYTQGPAHNPGGGYTPQPQQVYTQSPAHNPSGGYTPQPQQAYVQNPQRAPGGGYTTQPQQTYLQNSSTKPDGGNYTHAQAPKYIYNSGKKQSQPSSQNTVPLNSNSDDPGNYVYGYDGSKQRRTGALTKQMAAQSDNLAKGTQAGLDTIEGTVEATTSTNLLTRFKGLFKAASNAPAATRGLKDNAKAIMKPSPQATGQGWQPMKVNPLPNGLTQ